MYTGIESLDSFLIGVGLIFLFFIIVSIVVYCICLKDSIDDLNDKIDRLLNKRR